MSKATLSKGNATRQAILTHAANCASRVGLEGLSIGQLAAELGMSKSGLFGHFKSKEELQIQVLETISEQYSTEVIRPALQQPRGEARLRALFENWLAWALAPHGEREGCPFLAAGMEFDDRSGPVRDKLVEIQQRYIGVLEKTIVLGIEAGRFKTRRDPASLVQALYGIVLAFHFYHRLLRDPQAESRARKSFETYLSLLITDTDCDSDSRED